jgi:HSF-type DNA-binding
MFVVKDPDVFSKQVIPQYFDHNKFSSFARQLNFYGFRKMQSKPIRNSDFDAAAAKHVTFYNENFKKGRCDLLKKIQRSTRGGVALTPGDQGREIMLLREQVANLEQQISEISLQMDDRVRRLELDMLARMEQMMLAVQQQQRTQLQLEKASSVGTMNSVASQQSSLSQQHLQQQQQQQQQLAQVQAATSAWDANPYGFANRNSSVSSAINSVANAMGNQLPYHMSQQINGSSNNNGMHAPAPTLPPHPKQKQLPMGSMVPGDMGAPPDRMNSLRGISTLSRGVSGLTRGASVESSASAVLMRNSWEDKFFSMLMLDNNNSEQPLTEANLSPTPIAERAPATVSNTSMTLQSLSNDKGSLQNLPEQDDDLSDVSSGDMP